ncbi:DUF5615 family PIN-like protein [Gemmata sp.]|uniref:DUF5615 family PIN-like protein n=1 Tax=Gemmata sp. TaxID=1914242 RepID=UPI003F6F567D
MAHFYADEDFPHPVVEELRALGHDVLTALDDGRAGRGVPDSDVLARATLLGRAVLTHNRADFQKLHAADPSHSGIVSCTRDADPVALAARVGAAVARSAPLAGRLVRVVRPNPPAPAVP